MPIIPRNYIMVSDLEGAAEASPFTTPVVEGYRMETKDSVQQENIVVGWLVKHDEVPNDWESREVKPGLWRTPGKVICDGPWVSVAREGRNILLAERRREALAFLRSSISDFSRG